ncbi:RidA family protein [Nonomuraea endophytica]|uniref:RidA family protein n=1 Tax=Nonomuraea endophytica TaxID=714136 RepID=UPI0037C8FC1E
MRDRTVRLPALTGTDAGDAYERARVALGALGLTWADAVHVREYASARPDPAARPEGVTLSAIAVEGVLEDGHEVAVEVTACRGGGERFGTGRGVVTVAGEIVYLPAIVPADLTAGFGEQYRSCLEVAAELLKVAGSGLEGLVQTTDYTATATRADYPRCGRPRRELLGGEGADGRPVHPGAAGILVDRTAVEGAMVTLDAVGSRLPLRAVNPGWTRYDTLTYKPGVAAGGTLFMSGFGALEPATQRALHEGDLVAQAEYTYTAIEAVLREENLTGSDVVRLVEYITPPAITKYPEIVAVRERHFPNRPALTSVVCTALLRPEFLIEVVPTAVLR